MKKSLLDFDAYLFDLDGTLINTEPLHHKAWMLTIENHGFKLDWDFDTYLSHALLSRPHLFSQIYAACPGLKEQFSDGEAIRQKKILVFEQLLQDTPPSWMPGALEMLKFLKQKDKAMAIVTNSPRRHVLGYTHLGLDQFFHKIITIDEFKYPKPDPAGYNLALQELGHHPSKALIFEDSLKGVQSAKEAKADVVLIATDHYKKVANVDPSQFSVNSMSDLMPKP